MRQKTVQQGRSKRRGESYSGPYGEPLSETRTPLADFPHILLDVQTLTQGEGQEQVIHEEMKGASATKMIAQG